MNRRTIITALSASIPAALLTPRHPRAAETSVRLRVSDVVAWIEEYAWAWEAKDADAAALLFTQNAIYEAIPGVADQTFVGREAIRTYWASITAGQSDVTVLHGAPMVAHDRAFVELWVTMKIPALNPEGDHWVTLIETNTLYFETCTQVKRNVEYWNMMMGYVSPPAGWGQASL